MDTIPAVFYRLSKDLRQLLRTQTRLPQDRPEDAWLKITRMHRNCDLKRATLQAQVASLLTNFIEAKPF